MNAVPRFGSSLAPVALEDLMTVFLVGCVMTLFVALWYGQWVAMIRILRWMLDQTIRDIDAAAGHAGLDEDTCLAPTTSGVCLQPAGHDPAHAGR